MEDYEEILLQVTDILKAHNRYHESTDHKQAVEQIRNVVAPRATWEKVDIGLDEEPLYVCSHCGYNTRPSESYTTKHCPNCGYKMRR